MKRNWFQKSRDSVYFIHIDRSRIKKLKSILEDHHQRGVSLEEAEEVGTELMGLYECLAEGRPLLDHREEE